VDEIERLAAILEVNCAKREYSEAHERMVRRYTQGYDAWSLAAYLDAAERLIPKIRKPGNIEYIRMVDGKGNGRKTPRGSVISSSTMRRKGR
jgi:hypothetical protein